MRYLISYDLVTPEQNYNQLWEALRGLGAQRRNLRARSGNSRWQFPRTLDDSTGSSGASAVSFLRSSFSWQSGALSCHCQIDSSLSSPGSLSLLRLFHYCCCSVQTRSSSGVGFGTGSRHAAV